MTSIRNTLLTFLEGEGIDLNSIDEETPLFSSMLLDSFKMVDLILLVEKSCGIRIGPAELTLENFDTVSKIVAFVGSKQGITA